MAISKIIYKSSSSAQGETWMDLTQDTVSDASHIRSSYIGHLNDGTSVIGTYSGGSPSLQAKTNIAPTTSSQTITADEGYDGLSSVQINAMPSGTAGTPTATKGTVSNHAISVTPSVTNTTGYITGSTKTGTAVTVSASELVSGSETKTANGTYDVTNLASLVVSVSGGASNVVTGTFKGTNTGAMDVTLNYTGNGYPIAAIFYPTEGPNNSSTGTFYSLIQRYAIAEFFAVKCQTGTTPEYIGNLDCDKMAHAVVYKNSTSSATNYTRTSSQSSYMLKDTTASSTSTYTNALKFRSNKKMSVYVGTSGYSFAANIEYKYWIIYSS